MFVKPAREGVIVLDPQHNHLPLPAEGGHVPEDAYWLRILREGDVEEAEPPAEAAPEAEPAPEAAPALEAPAASDHQAKE